jgi:hypothetical protein
MRAALALIETSFAELLTETSDEFSISEKHKKLFISNFKAHDKINQI